MKPLIVALMLAADPVGSCTGDLNGDRRVDGRDVSAVLASFGRIGPCEPSAESLQIKDPEEREVAIALECWQDRPRADFNGDMRVDGLDLATLLSTFGCDEGIAVQAFILAGPPAELVDDSLEPPIP